MKENGTSESDPEFIKARNILATIQQQTQLKQQRNDMLRRQQMQQAQAAQQNQSNGMTNGQASVANGVSAQGAVSGGDTKTHTPSSSAPANQTSSQQSPVSATGERPRALMASNTPFTQEQLFTLRNQINAFKRLSKNLPITQEMQQQLFPSQKSRKVTTPTEALSTASQALNDANKQTTEVSTEAAKDASDSSSVQHRYKTFKSPWADLHPITYTDHSYRQNRTILPSIMPSGVDVDRMREERQIILYNRILARKAELEKLSANIGMWDTSKSDTPRDDGTTKLRALIEYKKLCLLPKQRQLRQMIAREMVHADNLAMTANRANYRRVKKQSLREARITEKLEKQQRDARETKEKKKHSDYLKAVLHHAEEVQKAGRDQRARIQRLGRTMLQTHQTIEKEEQKRIERTAKQRLQALKANDEETYLKLLGQAKDTRISHLLKQTDGFLKQLASSVRAQQRSTINRYGEGELPDESSSEDDMSGDEEDVRHGRKVDYYEVAHRIKEEVHAQSTNLVGGTLKEYQLKGLQWMISLYNNNLNGILADEMGLGKTIQTISLVTYLIEKKQQPGPYLVIVPLSTLTNWNNEFEKWAPSVSRIVYKGPPNARKMQQQQIRYGQFQVLLTTYEFIIKDRPVLSKIKWLHMIVDEGHRMKNANSKLSSTITQYYSTRYRLILTGTPLQNNLPELWALLNFVLPNIFKSVKSFDEWFNTPFANTGGQDKMELTEEEQLLVIRRLHKVLRPFLLRRLKKDVEKDLPDKQERVIKCSFSALQAKLYKQLVTDNKLMVSDSKGGKIAMRGLSNMLMQLRKLCNHPFVFEEVEDVVNPSKRTNDLIWRTAGKFELLDRILPKLKATGHRVLMFFQMTQIMNIMQDYMDFRGYNTLRLDGSTKSEDRSELLRLFNAPDSPYFCFLLSTRAGGLGLNLQTADTVIIYDSDWNPHQDLQAQDRAHRIGQKNEVRILRLISSNSVEEKILERANFKLDMDGKVIQAGKFDNKSTNEEREAMLRIMLEAADNAETLEEAEMDDDDLNNIMMRSEAEMDVFQKIDEDRKANDLYSQKDGLPRLMSEAELPDIYVNDDVPNAEVQDDLILGRGARDRTRVRYDDGLTEEQWLEAVDNSDIDLDEVINKNEAKKARRAANKEKKARAGEVVEYDSPRISRESSLSPAPKKRGRKPTKKRTADEASLDGDTPQPKRGRRPLPKVAETLSKEERDNLQTVLQNVLQTLKDLQDPEAPADLPRPILEPFLELPSKYHYPDYYELIKQPIAIKRIEQKVQRKEYQSLKQFRADIGLLCNNCRTFNEDASQLYQDANLIEVRYVLRDFT
jgi:ATP-dependent helicase STH1/SNF2